MSSSHPKFVIGVLTPGADIMQIYSALMVGGCSEISFVKDLQNSLICKVASESSARDREAVANNRKRKRDASPSSPTSSACLPASSLSSNSAPSPDSNLGLVLNGLMSDPKFQMTDVKEESLFLNTPTDENQLESPCLPDAIENAPLLLSRVFGLGGLAVNNPFAQNPMFGAPLSLTERRESIMSQYDDDLNTTVDGEGEMSGSKRKGPVVECMKCSSKIIMQQTRSLFRHIMTHASQEPYKCSECLQSSANSFNLRTHIYRKHSGKAQIIPNRTIEIEAEWRSLARECFPIQQERIDRCISYFVQSGAETLPLNSHEGKIRATQEIKDEECGNSKEEMS